MAKRVDQNDLDIDIKELSSYSVKNRIASVEDTRVGAEVEALKLRLSGKPAYVQNGFQGKYEVLASERQTEVRKLDASFTEVGAGIYRAGNPSWDKGSLWTIYSMDEDGSIIVSRMEDEEDESREALTAKLMVKSNIRGRNAAALFTHKVGEAIEFVDSQGRFAMGTVLEVDHNARTYIVQSDLSFEKEFVPFSLTADDSSAFTSEDASADDDFEYTPEPDPETAYTSEDASADDTYCQNEEDVEGAQSMELFDNSQGGESAEDGMELEADFNDQGTEDGLDDIQTIDNMGDSMYDDVEEETKQVGDVVEAAFDYDFTDDDFHGLDDMYQAPEDLQPAVDHYDFDDELYALASATEDSGDDDMVVPVEDLQSEQGAEDQHFTEADDEQSQVGESVETSPYDLNELHEVQRDQMAKYDRPEKDIWLI